MIKKERCCRALARQLRVHLGFWHYTLCAPEPAARGVQAVRTMHAPAGLGELEAARRRLAFDELLTLQLSLLLRRKLLQCAPPRRSCYRPSARRPGLPFVEYKE